jgi:hypothetical protein
MSVFVLWEDRAVGPITRFGPHVFLVACVASRIGMDRYQLARSHVIDGKPCAGNGNVLHELEREPLWDSGVHVVAVLDSDRLHHLFPGLIASRGAVPDIEYPRWSDAVSAEVRKRVPDHGQAHLEVCLLDRNLETLLALIGRGVRELDEALSKSLLDRDKILQRAAGDESMVEKACTELPSWGHLVAAVARRMSHTVG